MMAESEIVRVLLRLLINRRYRVDLYISLLYIGFELAKSLVDFSFL